MDALSTIVLKTQRNERTFEFIIPVGAQYGEAYDAAFEILMHVSKMAQTAAEQLKPKADEQSVEEAS